MPSNQPLLPFGPIRNSELFSNHWLQHRLHLEPEYTELRDQASAILRRLETLWKTESPNLPNYAEPQLEQSFIQPILRDLGWELHYQTHLQGRTPDYALFTSRITSLPASTALYSPRRDCGSSPPGCRHDRQASCHEEDQTGHRGNP